MYIWNVYIILLNDVQHMYVRMCSFSEYTYIIQLQINAFEMYM